MAVSTTEAGVKRIGNGTTTVFSFSFEGTNAAEIKVSNIVGSALVPITSGFTVSLNPGGNGGNVTFTTAPANNQEFYIFRETALTQLVSVSSQQKYDPNVVEAVWDKLTFISQELKAEVDRAVKVVPGSSGDDLLLQIEQAAATATAAQNAASASAVAAAESAADAEAVAATLVYATKTEAVTGTLTNKLISPATARDIVTAYDPSNFMINGCFDIWQRNVNFTVNGYTADRWLLTGTGGTRTVSREDVPIGTKFGVNSPDFHARLSVSGQSGSNSAGLAQRIEGVRSYEGETITIMGWARRFSGAGNMEVSAEQFFGSTGSALVTVPGVIVPLTSSWAPFAVTLTIPSAAGKIVSPALQDYLQLNFMASNGGSPLGIQTAAIDLWGVHVKLGTHEVNACTLYRSRHVADEYRKCLRYYYRQSGGGRIGTGHAFATSNAHIHTFFPEPLRVAPTAVELGTILAWHAIIVGPTQVTCNIIPTFVASTQYMATTVFSVATAITASVGVTGILTSTGAFIGWSAEL